MENPAINSRNLWVELDRLQLTAGARHNVSSIPVIFHLQNENTKTFIELSVFQLKHCIFMPKCFLLFTYRYPGDITGDESVGMVLL